MKKKLLILTTQQFGYLTDTFKYCQYASQEFEITFVCWDHDKPKINLPEINVKYISRKGSLAARNFRLLKALNIEIKQNYDVVFVNYTRGISFVKLLNPFKNIIFDIRTLSVSPSIDKRIIYNFFLKLESRFFKNVSIISDGVAKSIGIKNYLLLPLGADAITVNIPSTNNNLHLLYVGTLLNRDIIKCVRGFHSYCAQSGDKKAKFTIVGDSTENELDDIKNYVEECGLENQVVLAGRVPHSQLETFFNQASVGVSFIPMTKYYDVQPPTKTFEYLLSGIPVIGTKTTANEEILKNFHDSILINDNEKEFADAVANIRINLGNVNRAAISEKAQPYSWKLVINERFIPIIKEISNNSRQLLN